MLLVLLITVYQIEIVATKLQLFLHK